MAFLLITLPTCTVITRLLSETESRTSILYSSRSNRYLACRVQRSIASEITSDQSVARRSEITFHKHFQGAIGCDRVDKLLPSKYLGETYKEEAHTLKERARKVLETASKPLDQLEVIDTIQRLGLGYHYRHEIKSILNNIIFLDNHTKDTKQKNPDLYASALEFRLLREHGYKVHADAMFSSFKDEQGKFRPHLSGDLKGILYLYEASYYSVEGETVLDDARDFTLKHLEKHAKAHQKSTEYVSKLVSHALETPLAWRPPKVEASWFIYAYQSKKDVEPILLELAKLDFNMVQAKHQEEAKDVLRWWKSTRIAEKLSFSRDWPIENFLYAAVMIFEPQFEYARRKLARLNQLMTTMDDIYDVYGSLEELELFTDAVARWDANATNQLPYYMKLHFLALHNTLNELAYDVLRDHGFHIIPHLKKVFGEYCKAYLVEAKWYHSGYTPSLQEYLDNATISLPGEPMMGYAYFCVENPITKEALHCLEQRPDMFRWLAMIMRLADDLATSVGELSRGDVPKSVECYMHETGASKEEARKYLRNLLHETWKKVDKVRFSNPQFSQTFLGVVVDTVRLTLCTFPDGEMYDDVLQKSTDIAMSLFFQPIP